MSKIILITGSEGNIGCYLVAAVRSRYPEWTVLRVKNGSGRPFFDSLSGCYVGDLRDQEMCELIFGSNVVDYVVHAASTSYSHAGYKRYPFSVLYNDCAITFNLLRHTKTVKKFIFISSALAYEHASDSLLTEDMTARLPAPTSSYGVAKHLGEQAVQQASLEHGMPYTIWRPFNVVSPLESTAGEGRHVFVDFYRRIFIERVTEFGIFGSGKQVRCFIWVEEAVRCIVDALEDEATNNQVINLARDEPISLVQLKDLLVKIGKEMGVVPDGYDPPVKLAGNFAGVEMDIRIPSTKKLKELVKWESSITVEECFRKFTAEKISSDRKIISRFP